MQCEIRGMAEANPRISDTMPRRGRVNEVCREWVVHEDGALAYKLQKQEVEQHYVKNKERNALVREDFPKAKEEQEKEIIEAAEKYRVMVRQQEEIDSTYARRVAERIEREDAERRKRGEIRDQEVAKKMQAYEMAKNANHVYHAGRNPPSIAVPPFVADVNRVGLPIPDNIRFEPPVQVHHVANSTAISHNLRNLRLSDNNVNNGCYTPAETENIVESCSNNTGTSNYSGNYMQHVNRTPTPATLLPEDLNEIITDADLQEEANKRLQEEKDAELAKMLQRQEEEILNEEIDRDRLMAIEAQDKELARLLYEKEKAKLRRAKERARQKALLKKQAQSAGENFTETPQQPSKRSSICNESSGEFACSTLASCHSDSAPSVSPENSRLYTSDPRSSDQIEENHVASGSSGHDDVFRPVVSGACRTPPVPPPPVLRNVAIHIDPTYLLQQQSASMPNSLIFQEDTTAPPYMPIQGQRRNPPSAEKKQKKLKSKDGCKQQ